MAGALLVALSVVAASPVEAGSIVGNWDGSSRSWNNSDMATVKATAIAAGHTVLADSAITAANLAGDTHFVIGEPGSTPTAAELTALSNFVHGGGILLLFADSADSGLPALNSIAAGIGSTLSWSGSASNPSTLAAGNFATEGPPFNIVGQILDTSPGTAVAGGQTLSGDFIHYEQIGSGWVFGFADRSDHNAFNPTDTTVNGQLFLNILNHGASQPVPEPGSLSLLGLGLAAVACHGRRRRKPCAS